MGVAYGALVVFVLIAGIITGVVSMFLARKYQLEKPQILASLVGTLSGWFLLTFILYFASRAYLGMLAN
jgi:hypothetical protein